MSLQGRDTIDSAFSRDTTGSRDTREELFAMQQQANRIADEVRINCFWSYREDLLPPVGFNTVRVSGL